MILFVNACVRPDSRTKRLADCLLKRLSEPVKEVKLVETELPVPDGKFIAWRNEKSESGDFGDPVFTLAKDFASADTIVIAAPFWDLSFPSMLKRYLEHICVIGLTFCYENNAPKGLCRAKRLYYVTTAGAKIFNEAFGFGYVETLAKTFFHIPECRLIKAEGLDLDGADTDAIMAKAEAEIASAEIEIQR